MGEIIKNQDNRREFIDTLIELAEKDDKIVLMTPDVGFNYLEKFQEKFPNRFFNTGVTEASTVILAAAMALDGWKPYVYSMINFVAFRPFEMVRNAIALHHAPVTLLGVKGSAAYKFLGFSHNMVVSDEDVYHLRPYMKCWTPTDPEEVRQVLYLGYEKQEPTYIRL